MTTRHEQDGCGRWAVWLAGLVVVVAAGAATAHGLYEVALGSRTPAGIAWLYPVITDGLALVAYAATNRLAGAARRYAWSVVVLAAGLSGLAQATYLAGGVGTAPAGLRAGVGAWPAVAAAIAAHLLFLIGTHSAPIDASGTTSGRDEHRDGVPWDTVERPIPGVQPVPSGPAGEQPEEDAECPARHEGSAMGRPPGLGPALSQTDRARTVAELHAARSGALPSVRELAEPADVGRGTADRALNALRDNANHLHLIEDHRTERPHQ